MSSPVRRALVLTLLIGCVPLPATLASPILAQATAQTTPAPPNPVSVTPDSIFLNFEDADIATVIQAVSEIVGFSYVVAPDVHGKVTARTSGPIRRADVFPVFLSILEAQGFTAVKAGDLYKIIKMETARERAIPTFTEPARPPTSSPPAGAPSGAIPAADQPVTQVLVPRFVSAATLATIVRPLVSGRGNMIVDQPRNVLIVTDTSANVAKIAEIVKRLDVELAAEEVHVIHLQYADASSLAGILSHVFTGARLARPPVIAADRRTNSLVIRARRSEFEQIGRLLGHE